MVVIGVEGLFPVSAYGYWLEESSLSLHLFHGVCCLGIAKLLSSKIQRNE